MKKITASALSVLIILAMVLSFAACSKTDNAPISSNWKFDSVKSGVTSQQASDLSEEEIPILFIDNEYNVIYNRVGKYHYGWIAEQNNNKYRIDFSDSTKSMTAKITGDTMTVSVEGDSNNSMIFKVTDEKTVMPINDMTGPFDITAKVVGDFLVEFTNNGNETWGFGEYYHLEVMKNGKPYYLPPEVPLTVHDLGHELAPGQSDTLSYDLSPYGKLMPGDYRVAAGDGGDGKNFYYAYFTVNADGTIVF